MARDLPPAFVGSAGWALRKSRHSAFSGEGSHLSRYARRLTGVEVNSSFYRPHLRRTYSRWAAETPAGFRFAVKVPATITHDLRLRSAEGEIARFVEETSGLGEKRGPLLAQLPPTLPFERGVAEGFFAAFRARYAGPLVCEPRHPSWFRREAEETMELYEVTRAVADPPPVLGAMEPGGHRGLVYCRLHGWPRMYYSPYPPERLSQIAASLARWRAEGATIWCVFDNTASGAAIPDALALKRRLALRRIHRRPREGPPATRTEYDHGLA